jgi:hypothetical protein
MLVKEDPDGLGVCPSNMSRSFKESKRPARLSFKNQPFSAYSDTLLADRAEILEKGEMRSKTLLGIGAVPLAVIAAKDFNCQVTNII